MAAQFAWPFKDPPLVREKICGSRQRLRGPNLQSLPKDAQTLLEPVSTTVTDNCVVRFGDQLLVLSHATEVLLQTDLSRKERIVDESHSQRKQFDAFRVTTGKVLRPCARNIFIVGRADRNDGFGDSLEVRFGQHVRILANSFVHDQILYLHLESTMNKGAMRHHALLIPRAGRRTLWKIVPAPPYEDPMDGGTMRNPEPKPFPGQVVRVNDHFSLEHVESGQLLMSDLSLVSGAFGVECRTFGETLGPHGLVRNADLGDNFGVGVEGRGRLCAVWSFVNDTWVDQVEDVKANQTIGNWKEDDGDDFEKGHISVAAEIDLPEFNPFDANARSRIERELKILSQDPNTKPCERIFPFVRGRGSHFIRKMRMMFEESDVQKNNIIPSYTFEGILAGRMIRLTRAEFEQLSEAFKADSEEYGVKMINYQKFLLLLEGILPEQRLDSVRRAYRKLLQVSDGQYVTVKDLMENWKPDCSRDVQEGRLEVGEAYQDFMSQWGDAAGPDGHISAQEFLRYYRDVSMCYEDGEEFVHMLKIAWDL